MKKSGGKTTEILCERKESPKSLIENINLYSSLGEKKTKIIKIKKN